MSKRRSFAHDLAALNAVRTALADAGPLDSVIVAGDLLLGGAWPLDVWDALAAEPRVSGGMVPCLPRRRADPTAHQAAVRAESATLPERHGLHTAGFGETRRRDKHASHARLRADRTWQAADKVVYSRSLETISTPKARLERDLAAAAVGDQR
jgi:hypothetical protein